MSAPGFLCLQPALLPDRLRAYAFLTQSDATRCMMGPPDFSDHPIPTWAEFCADYGEGFFTPAGDGHGRLYMIRSDSRDVGCISYDGLEDWKGIAELDVWIASSTDWGRGIGSRAVRELSQQVLSHEGVESLLMRPSARNGRAIAAYRKALSLNPEFSDARNNLQRITQGAAPVTSKTGGDR